MMTTVTTDKPFQIEKKRVYEAYKAVRSNRGAAGVDDQTLEPGTGNSTHCVEGTWGAEIIDELKPRQEEHLIAKKGFGGLREHTASLVKTGLPP